MIPLMELILLLFISVSYEMHFPLTLGKIFIALCMKITWKNLDHSLNE